MKHRGKQVLSIFLAAVLLIGTVPATSFAALEKTEAVPALVGTIDAVDDGDTNYRFIEPVKHQKTVPEGYIGIYTPEDLNRMRENLTANYILMNDIDMSEWGGWEPVGNDNFTSISIKNEEEFNAAKQLYHTLYDLHYNEVDDYSSVQHTYYYFSRFRGNFEGNGYEIRNLMIHLQSSVNSGHGQTNAGLFGYVEDGAIKNLGLLNINLFVSSTSRSGAYVGSIAGQSDAEISNCYSTGQMETIIQNSEYESVQVLRNGGIVGYCSKKISQCYSLSGINVLSEVSKNSSWIYSGGIAGSSVNIQDCYNKGDIETFNLGNGTAPEATCGGIVGYITASNAIINNCYNSGKIHAESSTNMWGDAKAGGIAGDSNSIISGCYNSGTVSSCSSSIDSRFPAVAGGISGSWENESGGIVNSYNIGMIKAVNTAHSAYAYAGGLIGYISWKINNPIANSYNAGTVQSSNLTGALVGKTTVPTTIQNCFYNDLINEPIGSGGSFTLNNVSYLSPEQFSRQSSFSGFDFANVWRMDTTLGRPVLRDALLPDTGETERPDPEPGDNTPLDLPILDEASAKSFLGFLMNDSSFLKKDISDNPFYQLLTGAYQNDLSKQLEYGNALLTAVSSQLSAHINDSSEAKTYLRQSLINYLQKQLASMKEIPEEECNHFVNEQLKNLNGIVLDSLVDLTAKTTGIVVTEEIIDNINLISSTYSQIIELPKKIETFVDSSVAAVQAIFLPLQGELNGRYRYFDLYLQQRKTFEPNDEIFRFIMDYNSWALRQENGAGALINCLPNVSSWTENIPTIESWAEYIYQLQLALTNQKQSSQFSKGNYKRISIQCPIDVFVYDASGALSGSIEGDLAQPCTDDQIYLAVLGDSKLVCIPEDAGYSLKIVAREEGSLSYSCQTVDGKLRESVRTNFYEIPLTAGKTFYTDSKEDYASLQIVDEHGKPQETVSGQETIPSQEKKCKVLLNIRGAGSVTGSDIYTKGDYACLTATPDEGYAFDGWYLKGQKLSDKPSGYGFTVMGDVIIEARFLSVKTPVTGLSISKPALTMESGTKAFLTATVTPADATEQAVLWTSSNEFIITVNQEGQLIAHKPGTAVITVASADGGFSSTCTVTVKEPVPPQVAITTEGKDTGDVLYFKLPSIWDAYKKHSVTLGYTIDPNVEIQSVKWSYAKWSASNAEATIESPNSAQTTIRPNGKGIGARSVWVTVTVTDTAGNQYQDTVKVRFYKFSWQK